MEEPIPAAIDGVDAELLGMSDAELEALVSRLSRSHRASDLATMYIAKALLRERRSASATPELTPKVAAIVPPKSAAPPVPTHGELKFETILGRVKGSADPQAAKDLANRLAQDLTDFGSLGFYLKAAELVRAGKLKPGLITQARRQAKSETATRPGAVFVRYLQAHAPELFPHREGRA